MVEFTLIVSFVLAFWLAVWEMVVSSALWLLVGFLAVGVAHVLLPSSFIERNLKKPGFGSVFKSSLFGIPLPLCSCSVIPVGVWLRNQGASRGATASFFISTPEIGVDSFLLSYGLLGKFFALIRLGTALVTALVTGFLIDTFKPGYRRNSSDAEDSAKENAAASCCAKKTDSNEPVSISESKEKTSIIKTFRRVCKFGFVEVVDDLALLLSIGFFLAALVSVIIPDEFFGSLQISNYLMILLMLAASMPFYVCATSSTPIAAALLLKGMNPGAVLVFLFAGPATNFATMLILRKTLGQRAFLIYVASVSAISVGVACLVELAIDYEILSRSLLAIPAASHDGHGLHGGGLLHQLSGVALIALLSWRLMAQSKKRRAQAKKNAD